MHKVASIVSIDMRCLDCDTVVAQQSNSMLLLCVSCGHMLAQALSASACADTQTHAVVIDCINRHN
jgi:DNA-directed RNA polymerase subunit N (RpoN/RPB10)